MAVPVKEHRAMRILPLLAGAVMTAGLAIGPAAAEVQKFMNICGKAEQGVRLCPSFALALTPPDGWVEDKTASRQNGVQMMVPKGKTFGDAEALIYVKVSYRQDKGQPLADFVRVSQDRWRAAVPDTKIGSLPELDRKDGKPPFLVFQYENPSRAQQAHERVAFGLDTDKDGTYSRAELAELAKRKKGLEQADRHYKEFLRAH